MTVRATPYATAYSPPAPVLAVRVGRPAEEPQLAVRALVDTRADITVVPEPTAVALGLPRVGSIEVASYGGDVASVPTYAARLEVAGTVATVEVLADGDELLLGRDVLNRHRITLDGPVEELRVDD